MRNGLPTKNLISYGFDMRQLEENVFAFEDFPQISLTVLGYYVYCVEGFVIEGRYDFNYANEVWMIELFQNYDLSQDSFSVDFVVKKARDFFNGHLNISQRLPTFTNDLPLHQCL